MKALSIKQPWAHLIIHGCPQEHPEYGQTISYKDIENRTWSTKFRGKFYVHASAKPDKEALKKYIEFGFDPSELEYGSIIGVVDLVDVVRESNSKWFKGPVGFVLKDPRMIIDPIKVRGQLGFWEYKDA